MIRIGLLIVVLGYYLTCPVAVLTIPSIGLSGAVYPVGRVETPGGYSYQVLDNDIGWHNGTSHPCGEAGNTVLNGHNPGVFSRLPEVRIGDTLFICGRVFTITDVVTVYEGGDDQERRQNALRYVKQTEDRRVTLITCMEEDTRLIVVGLLSE